MRNEYEIELKEGEIQQRLSRVLHGMEEEMQKPHRERNFRLLHFLDREKNVWEFALAQINWILGRG